jgi:hypothetical protein
VPPHTDPEDATFGPFGDLRQFHLCGSAVRSHTGLLEAAPDGHRLALTWQANIGKRIDVHVPVAGGEVVESGDFDLDGVPFPTAEIRIEVLKPGDASISGAAAMLPTGNRIDTLTIPDLGDIRATLINAGNPKIFIAPRRIARQDVPAEYEGPYGQAGASCGHLLRERTAYRRVCYATIFQYESFRITLPLRKV